jgi:hypothetical protein
MFWFVVAVVVTMLAVIDLATNLHLLVLRRLRRKRARRAAQAPAWHPTLRIDPSLDEDPEAILKALHGVGTG